jgi:hypothetical protein
MTRGGMQAPNSKHQAPEKLQLSNTNCSFESASWNLKIGASLELGAWSLEFRRTPPELNNSKQLASE